MSENHLNTALYGFADSIAGGENLARALGLAYLPIELHRFPDGESLVRMPAFADEAILYRSLDRPNDKLIEIILAAAEMRRQGTRHLTLVAPYLPYMRQDIAFRPGEAVSQKIIGALLTPYFDRFIAVDPHLHRTHSLDTVFPGRDASALTAAALMGQHLASAGMTQNAILVGPDEESTPLVRTAAEAADAEWLVARKVRHGDNDVTIELQATPSLQGRRAIIIDDVISSGGTILTCTGLLRGRGAARVDVCTTHALYGADVAAAFAQAGIGEVISCDGVPHPSNRMALAPLLAPLLTQELVHER